MSPAMDRSIKPKALLLPFIAMLRHHWVAMALGSALALLATLAAVGLLSLSGWFLAATAFAGLDIATAKAFNFFLPSIGVRLFAMTRTVARYGERIICHDATFRILETLRTWCYLRIEPLSPARLEGRHSGDLLSRITTDIDTLDNLYLRVLSPTVVAAAATTLLVGFMACFHPLIAATSAGMLVIAGTGIPILAHTLARTDARRLNTQTARLRTALVDGIHGLAALLTCEAEPRYLERIERLHQELVHSQDKISSVTGLTSALTSFTAGTAVIVTLAIGVEATRAGRLSGPLLALLVLTVMAGFDAVAALPAAYQFLGRTRKAAARLLDVTHTQPAVTFPARSPACLSDGSVTFHAVHFQYADTDRPALIDISWTVPQASRVAVMGPTGAGKSTLLHLLARFEDPDRGIIRVGNRPLTDLAEADLRMSTCIIDQHAHIFNGTLRDNLAIANPQAGKDEMTRAMETVMLGSFLDDLPEGLDTWVGEAGRLLSGGQARRLAIARALLSDAPVWAFDEPTEGLDSQTAVAMMDRILECAAGRTVIMITHRSEALRKMDQVVLMREGKIVASGEPLTLYRQNALYRELVKTHPGAYG